MTNLISGKEALIALANGEDVLWRTKTDAEIKCFKGQTPNLEIVLSDNCDYRFWVKPRTITINGIEVPAPFKPKRDQPFYALNAFSKNGYQCFRLSDDYDSDFENALINFVWRTEEEIKQVVAALRQIFGGA